MIGEDKPIQRVNTRVPGGFGAGEEMHTGQAIVFLQDWDERDVTTAEIVEELRGEARRRYRRARDAAGRRRPRAQHRAAAADRARRARLRGAGAAGATACWRAWRRIPGCSDADSDYKETRPQMRVEIDYDRAADLGVSTEEIGTTLETMMGSRRVTTFVRGRRGVRRRAAGRHASDRTAPAASRTSTCARAAAASWCRCPPW